MHIVGYCESKFCPDTVCAGYEQGFLIFLREACEGCETADAAQ
jgi:hypothetical protein